MKSKLVLAVVFLILFVTLFYLKDHLAIFTPKATKSAQELSPKPKSVILRVGLVADSENDNDLLAKALDQLKGMGVNFVIGLGDWSQVGTIKELSDVKVIFDKSKLTYYLTPGDHDLWDSRNRGQDALTNYKQIFGEPSQVFDKNGIRFVILDNSDIYKGIDPSTWSLVTGSWSNPPKLHFVFAHKTPFHPQSAHIMGEDSPDVARQAQSLLSLIEAKKLDGYFSGDLHFFAKFNSPSGSVKITTIGAVEQDRNFQGPRFGILTVYKQSFSANKDAFSANNDYSWNVEDVEIR